jgi:hypothetical protein
MKPILFTFFILILIGCNQGADKPKNINREWSSLQIITDQYVQYNFINHDPSDSTIVRTYLAGSLFQPVKHVKMITKSYAFTQREKDSIYLLVKDIVVNPLKPKGFCTEFVGRIEIKISYGDQVTQSCLYTSVCDWTKLSDKTLKLSSILQKRIKSK